MNKNKKLALFIGAAAVLFGTIIFFKAGTAGTAALWSISRGGEWLLPLVVVAALIDSVNPCAFGVLLLTLGFLLSLGRTRREVLALGGAYIIGVFAAYFLIGLGLLQALHLFNTPHFMAKAGALLVIILGSINVIGELFPSFPIKLRIPHAAHAKMAVLMNRASLPAAFLLGALVGLCEFPCTGGPYLMVLGLLHDAQTYLKGVWFLILYNLIFIAPLALILFIGSDRAVLAKVEVWKQSETKNMRLWGGVAMVALGLLILLFAL